VSEEVNGRKLSVRNTTVLLLTLTLTLSATMHSVTDGQPDDIMMPIDIANKNVPSKRIVATRMNSKRLTTMTMIA